MTNNYKLQDFRNIKCNNWCLWTIRNRFMETVVFNPLISRVFFTAKFTVLQLEDGRRPLISTTILKDDPYAVNKTLALHIDVGLGWVFIVFILLLRLHSNKRSIYEHFPAVSIWMDFCFSTEKQLRVFAEGWFLRRKNVSEWAGGNKSL